MPSQKKSSASSAASPSARRTPSKPRAASSARATEAAEPVDDDGAWEQARLAELKRLHALSYEDERSVPAGLEVYRTQPHAFVTDHLGEFAWSKQVEVMESVRDNRYTAVPSCHGVGKSHIAARIVAWWLSVHPVGQAFAVTTAPTASQVRAILWQQIRRAHGKGNLPGRVNQTEWWMGDEMTAMGRKPSEYNPDAFQGIHALYVLVVLDEASGVPASLVESAETLMTNPNARLLAIGNPTDPASPFAKMCRPASGYNVIPISAFDSPNFTSEKVPEQVSEELVSTEWVDERGRKWGESSALYQSRVLGIFPEVSDDTLIPLAWVERPMARGADGWPDEPQNRELGVDVARYGSDESVIGLREGKSFRVIWVGRKLDTMTTTGHVVEALRSTGAFAAKVDVVGLGAGVYDRLRELNHPAVAMGAGEQAIDPERFANARAEWWWNLRELFEADQAIVDPEDEELADQLSSQKFQYDSKGRVLLESKDSMRKRGLTSPDRGDTMAMAFAPVLDETEYMVEVDERVTIQ